MKSIICAAISSACLSIFLLPITHAAEEEVKPIKGEDLIVVPAVPKGFAVHNAFQSHMVLQRNKPISIWGWAEKAGEQVTITFSGDTQSTQADNARKWKVTFPAKGATSEDQSMTIKSGAQESTLTNILIGDVWVLGGQSNMEFEIAKLVNGQQEIQSANFENIRHISIPYGTGPDLKHNFPIIHQWSSWSSRHFYKGEWEVCTPETVRSLSGIGYVFARRIHMTTGVPIGVIDASRGGTTVEAWTPLETVRKIDTAEVKAMLDEWDTKIAEFDPKADLENRIAKHTSWVAKQEKAGKSTSGRKAPTTEAAGPAASHHRPGGCYAGILAPLQDLAVKGAIWHQGFNNALGSTTAAPIRYHQLFKEMIPAWRTTFGDAEMPFGIISLCTAGEPQDHNNYVARMQDNGVAIRAVQYQTFLDFKEAGDENVGFASSFDQRRAWYHPQIKIPVGERMARWALATEYGYEKSLKWEPATIVSATPEDGKLNIKLSGRVNPHNDGPMLGFAIAGEDKKFQPAMAEYFIKGKDSRGRDQKDTSVIVLSSPLVEKPVHYRYAWSRNPNANLKNGDGFDTPLATQRSDDWSLADLYEAYVGKPATEEPGSLSRRERGELSKAMKAEDIRRRLHEAKAFIEEHGEASAK